ncbi:MAG TPA: HAMP domain-containing protein [Rhodopila sp.]|nr:HAMP domain-containing protein [Rhodopila sp.]
MSLRTRLVLWLGCVLAITLSLGCALAGWHAAGSVRAEMQAALATGRQEVVNGLAEIRESGGGVGDLRHLVATFDGNRHARAIFTDGSGTILAASVLQPPARPIPAWFRRLIGPVLAPVVLASPSGLVTLVADPTNEVGEVWGQANDAARMLALFFGLTVLLVYWAVGRALAPLERLAAAFGRIGAGDYAARVNPAGPPELIRLASGFNGMAEQLGAAEARNRQLQEQLLSSQEEERADLARDLHDEIGPFLFAAGIDAAGIPALLQAGRLGEVGERAEAIRDSVAHMQMQVRSILGRLRPLSFGSVGLAEAIGNLVAFWRDRHPAIDFALDVAEEEEDGPSEAVRSTVCRIVQESLCNAVRHGAPGRIEISVTREGADMVVQVVDDGVGPGAGGVIPGFGLVGMRERVRAQAGTLAIAARGSGSGLAVTARLPCDAAA